MTFNIINPSSSSFSFSVNRCDFLQICFSIEEKDRENIWQHVCYRLPCFPGFSSRLNIDTGPNIMNYTI